MVIPESSVKNGEKNHLDKLKEDSPSPPKGKEYSPTFSNLRQKLSSVICSTDAKINSSNMAQKKKDISSGALYNLLASALDNMPDG